MKRGKIVRESVDVIESEKVERRERGVCERARRRGNEREQKERW